MPIFNYKIVVKVEPGQVGAANQKTSFDTILGQFESRVESLKFMTAGMKLWIAKVAREADDSGEKEDENWSEFRERLRRTKP